MKPHMMHIAQTLARKIAVEDASKKEMSYKRYKELVAKAQADMYSDEQIIGELNNEINRIMKDARDGDPLFQQGVHNAKVSTIAAINLVIQELENEGEKQDEIQANN